jgi:Tol biopolymer transport system component
VEQKSESDQQQATQNKEERTVGRGMNKRVFLIGGGVAVVVLLWGSLILFPMQKGAFVEPQSASANQYELVPSPEREFGLVAEFRFQSFVQSSDNTGPVEGAVVALAVGRRQILLETNKIVQADNQSWIVTKDYGRIRISGGYEGDHPPNGLCIWLTQHQKDQFVLLREELARTTESTVQSQRWRALSREGQLIAYLLGRKGGYDLYVMRSDGSNQKRLTDGRQDARQAVWSPDGKQLAFVIQGTNQNSAIYCINPDGSGLRRLADCGGSGGFPVWSPDGTRIAYNKRQGKIDEIHDMETTGENDRRLTEGTDHFCRAWSPDGKMLAFERLQNRKWQIGIMDIDGTNIRMVPAGDDDDGSPLWSKDGSQLFFKSFRGGTAGLFSFNLGETSVRRLTDPSHSNCFAAPSPCGDLICFVSERDGRWELYAMKPDGNDQHRILKESSPNGNISFSPDGQFIAFDSNRGDNYEIYVTGIDGCDVHQLTRTEAPQKCVEPRWQPRRDSL